MSWDAYVEISGTIEHETDKAILFKTDAMGDPKVWVPKSLIDWTEEASDGLTVISVPEWFAEREF
jgi:hypothetical protein